MSTNLYTIENAPKILMEIVWNKLNDKVIVKNTHGFNHSYYLKELAIRHYDRYVQYGDFDKLSFEELDKFEILFIKIKIYINIKQQKLE